MSSLNSLQANQILAKGTILSFGTDGPVAIRIRKIGTETATSVTVTTATNIVLVGSTTTDTLAFATYTSVGTVVDAINATGRWEAKILDARRSQLSASTLLDGAITAGYDGNSNTVYDVKQDTSTALLIGACLSPHRDFDLPNGHRVHLLQIRYAVNMGTAAADSVQGWKRKATNSGSGPETQLISKLSVDTTDTTISWASGVGKITLNPDEEIFVLVKDAATLADATSNYVEVTGVIE